MSPVKGRPNGMPGTGRWNSIHQSRYVKAQLIRAYQRGGRHYIDAHAAKGAGGWTGVPVVEFGGGSGRFMHMPIAGDQGDGAPALAVGEEYDPTDVASAQVWLFFDGSSNNPVCVGAVQHSKRGLVTDTPSTGADADRGDGIGVNDFALVNGGSSFVVDAEGVIAVAPKTGKLWNLKLKGGAKARISREGKAPEALLLGRRSLARLDTHYTWIDALEGRISRLETAMTGVLAFLASGVGGSYSAVPPFVQVVGSDAPNRPDDTLLAAAVEISDDDQGTV